MEAKRYEEIGTNYRFVLGWRHAAFAGDLVIMYGILSLTFAVYKEIPVIAWIVPALGWPVGVLLWMVDVRTRELYHAAIRAGKAFEGKRGGFFTQLAQITLPKGGSSFQRLSQSTALDLLFFGSSLSLLILAIFLYLWTRGVYIPGLFPVRL
jgi:hypothetical protein